MLGSGAALAQQEGPGGIVVEPLTFFPGIDLSLGHDDNLFLTRDRRRESAFAILSPWLRIEGRPAPHRFDLSFKYDIGRYEQSTNDDYEDYGINFNTLAVITGRADVKVHLEYIYAHDPRGSTDRPLAPRPDEYENAGGEAAFGYGAPGAQGRVEVMGGFYTRQYQNNRIFTEASDRDTGIFGGTFFWRVAPRTQLLLQGEQRRIDYQQVGSTQDSDENRLYLGARWDATAKTSGYAKFGYLKKDFEAGSREDLDTSSWDVGVAWSPLSYSVFDLFTSRQTEESTGVGDAILASIYRLTWTHSWNSRFRHRVLLGWRNDEYQGQGVTREDDTATVGLGLQYQFRRWMRLGFDYTYSDRDSNDPTVIYDRNVFFLSLSLTL